jgi:hypothetical protein
MLTRYFLGYADNNVVKEITITSRKDAIDLARRSSSGFRFPAPNSPSSSTAKFGKEVVKGWLQSIGESVRPREIHVPASQLGVPRFPSGQISRRFDIINSPGTTAYEVKTRRGLFLWEQEKSQLKDYLAWRDSLSGRQFFLAVVNYYCKRVNLDDNLILFAKERRMLPILRFTISWDSRS